MVRKIFKSGNSLVISLPKEYLQQLELNEGSEIEFSVAEDGNRLILEPSTKIVTDIDEEFANQLDDFIEQDRPALEALAK